MLPAAPDGGKQVCRLEFHAENPQSAQRAALASGQRLVNDDPRELERQGAERLRSRARSGSDIPSTRHFGFYRETGKASTTSTNAGLRRTDSDYGRLVRTPIWFCCLKEPIEGPAVATFTITDVAVNEQASVSGTCTLTSMENRRQVDSWDRRALPTNAEFFCPRDSPLRSRAHLVSYRIAAKPQAIELVHLGYAAARFSADEVPYGSGRFPEIPAGRSHRSYRQRELRRLLWATCWEQNGLSGPVRIMDQSGRKLA